MASRFLDISAPVARALNTNALIVAIETGFFMRLPYPKNRDALAECEQAFARRACVPCCIGVVDGRLKAGLTKDDMDRLCQAGGSCARGDLPGLAASGGTSGAGAGATMAIARMAGIEPVMAPGLSDSLTDLESLCSSARLVFCGRVPPDTALLYASRSVAILGQADEDAVAEAYLLQRELEMSESTVVPCGETLGELADRSCAAAMALKKKSDYTR